VRAGVRLRTKYLPHSRLADVDAELQQFAVNAWRVPQPGFSRLIRRIRARISAAPDFPATEHTKCLAMPGNDGGGLDNHQGRAPPSPMRESPIHNRRSELFNWGRFFAER
jgi:hypothetical protein